MDDPDRPPTYSEACQSRVLVPTVPTTTAPGNSDQDDETTPPPPSPSDVQVTFDHPDNNNNNNGSNDANNDIMTELDNFSGEDERIVRVFLASYVNTGSEQQSSRHQLPVDYRGGSYNQHQQEQTRQDCCSSNITKRIIKCVLAVIVLASVALYIAVEMGVTID